MRLNNTFNPVFWHKNELQVHINYNGEMLPASNGLGFELVNIKLIKVLLEFSNQAQHLLCPNFFLVFLSANFFSDQHVLFGLGSLKFEFLNTLDLVDDWGMETN